MSRGLGKRERAILSTLTDRPIELGGATRAERVANRRAARSLERRGVADVFMLWNDGHTRGLVHVVRAGATMKDGRTWKSVNVACVPPGARATHKRQRFLGSLRTIAESEMVSVTTIRRDKSAMKKG
jgi:hypothetical protein